MSDLLTIAREMWHDEWGDEPICHLWTSATDQARAPYFRRAGIAMRHIERARLDERRLWQTAAVSA
jgi:hypothetical protein